MRRPRRAVLLVLACAIAVPASGIAAPSSGDSNGRVVIEGVTFDPQTYSFHASARGPAPNATGSIELHTLVNGADALVKADVVCMGIVGNRAHIAALVRRAKRGSTEGGPAGHLIWTVEDNGNGDVPDQASLVFVASSSLVASHCAGNFPLTLHPNSGGDIQVKP